MIRPFLRDIINDHETEGERKVHSGNSHKISLNRGGS